MKNECPATYREYTANSKMQLYRERPQPIFLTQEKKKSQTIVLLIPRIYSASDLANATESSAAPRLPDNQVSTVLIS